MIFDFFSRFSKNYQINFFEVRPVGAELFNADRVMSRYDGAKSFFFFFFFLNFTNAPEFIVLSCYQWKLY
jgi:hypothetical protein